MTRRLFTNQVSESSPGLAMMNRIEIKIAGRNFNYNPFLLHPLAKAIKNNLLTLTL